MSETNDGKEQPSGGKIPGKEALAPPLPKRFYASVSVSETGEGYAVLLDGRPLKTPGKHSLAVPSAALARSIATEWEAQKDVIDPSTMPLTRIVNSALDGVAEAVVDVAADIAAFAASDLLCYRAETPAELRALQQEAWDPIVAWARTEIESGLKVVDGLMPVEQPASLRAHVQSRLEGRPALEIAALHVMTTLTGSALLALAVAAARITHDEAWAKAHVDEDWQIAQWGEDWEASERRRRRAREFRAASDIVVALRAS